MDDIVQLVTINVDNDAGTPNFLTGNYTRNIKPLNKIYRNVTSLSQLVPKCTSINLLCRDKDKKKKR